MPSLACGGVSVAAQLPHVGCRRSRRLASQPLLAWAQGVGAAGPSRLLRQGYTIRHCVRQHRRLCVATQAGSIKGGDNVASFGKVPGGNNLSNLIGALRGSLVAAACGGILATFCTPPSLAFSSEPSAPVSAHRSRAAPALPLGLSPSRLADSAAAPAAGPSAAPASAAAAPASGPETAPGENGQVSTTITGPEVYEEAWKLVDETFLPARAGRFDRAAWAARLAAVKASPPRSRDRAYKEIKASLGTLGDPYSRWVAPDDFQKLLKYDITGVGLNLVEDPTAQAGLRVLGMILGSPAADAGVRQGDELLEVGGAAVAGKSAFEAASLIQGEPGTWAELKVRHPDGSEALVSLQRGDGAPAVASPVSSRMEAGHIGYIKLKEFNALAERDVAAAVAELEAAGADSFVLDLRDNLGGLVQAGVEIAKLFLEPGSTVVYAEGRVQAAGSALAAVGGGLAGGAGGAAGVDPLTTLRPVAGAAGAALTRAPLAVLVNGKSASASEILAGSLHDNCRASLVGSRTFGKGLIQSVYELSDGSGLILTVGKYVTPALRDIDREGLQPDFRSFPGFEQSTALVAACKRPVVETGPDGPRMTSGGPAAAAASKQAQGPPPLVIEDPADF